MPSETQSLGAVWAYELQLQFQGPGGLEVWAALGASRLRISGGPNLGNSRSKPENKAARPTIMMSHSYIPSSDYQ